MAIVAVLALVAGCGDDDGGEETGAGGVEVTLQEFAVIPAPTRHPPGEVTFNVTNIGPEDVHEFVVFKTDLAPDALPTARGRLGGRERAKASSSSTRSRTSRSVRRRP